MVVSINWGGLTAPHHSTQLNRRLKPSEFPEDGWLENRDKDAPDTV